MSAFMRTVWLFVHSRWQALMDKHQTFWYDQKAIKVLMFTWSGSISLVYFLSCQHMESFYEYILICWFSFFCVIFWSLWSHKVVWAVIPFYPSLSPSFCSLSMPCYISLHFPGGCNFYISSVCVLCSNLINPGDC